MNVQPQQKKLYIFHEVHLEGRDSEATAFAKGLKTAQASLPNAAFFKVKLFLEGLTEGEEKKVTEELGVTAVGIENGEFHELAARAGFARAAALYNALIWANGSKNRGRAGVKEFLEKVTTALPQAALMDVEGDHRPPYDFRRKFAQYENREAIETSLICFNYIASMAECMGLTTGGQVADVMWEVANNGLEGMTPLVRRLVNENLKAIRQEKLDALAQSILAPATQFFKDKAEADVELMGKQVAWTELMELTRKGDVMNLALMLSMMLGWMHEIREVGMVHRIAREEFNEGVLKIGQEHIVRNEWSWQLLEKSGLTLITVEKKERLDIN
ncbi:Uncharacterised protein [Candidatus Gugararchaeum adminiculabundum]|nr:Uncharacterised protein [Candidatus Gugararchaeum adminiculabundum]